MDYITLGKRIRERRKDMHLTQQYLAEAAGISASFLGHIERGSRVLSLDTLMSLCRALNATPNELLGADSLHMQSEATGFPAELLQSAVDLMRKYDLLK